VVGHSGDGEAALKPTHAWLTRYNLRPSVNAERALFCCVMCRMSRTHSRGLRLGRTPQVRIDVHPKAEAVGAAPREARWRSLRKYNRANALLTSRTTLAALPSV
jgi:hypothetical protein